MTRLPLLFVVCLFQLHSFTECSLPRFPTALAKNPEYSKYFTDDRIVGGFPVEDLRSAPYQASLQKKSTDGKSSKHYCGCTLVSKNYVVTAAHCTRTDASTMRVMVGSLFVNNGTDAEYHNVRYCRKYPEYNSNTVQGDCAICRLDTPADISKDTITPLALPTKNVQFQDGEIFRCSGWGTTSEGGSVSQQLRQVEVPSVNNEECKKNYGDDAIHPEMLCAGLPEGGKDSCQGDSGGPLVAKVIENGRLKLQLSGVVSWGYGCARPGYPGVYTRVGHDKIRAWILGECDDYTSENTFHDNSLSA